MVNICTTADLFLRRLDLFWSKWKYQQKKKKQWNAQQLCIQPTEIQGNSLSRRERTSCVVFKCQIIHIIAVLTTKNYVKFVVRFNIFTFCSESCGWRGWEDAEDLQSSETLTQSESSAGCVGARARVRCTTQSHRVRLLAAEVYSHSLVSPTWQNFFFWVISVQETNILTGNSYLRFEGDYRQLDVFNRNH